MDGACSMNGGEEMCMQDFGGKTSGEKFGRSKRRWEDIIKLDLRAMQWEEYCGSG